jgi:type I restriction enzyme S subunit
MKPEIKERIEKINRGQVPEGYKETKLGIIPSKWEIRTIGQLVEDGIIQKPMDGNHGALHPTSKDYVDKGIPFILATDLEGNKLSLSKCKHIKKEVADKLQKGFSVEGDVLLTHKGSVGNTVVVPKIETEYIMLTPQVTFYRVNDRDKLSNYYLHYHFQGETFQRQLKVMSKGATRDYIGIVAQNNLEIILPTDIKEQQKIADILSTWDKAIELKEKLIEQKKEQKKGLMQRLLTGKVRLPGFKGEWIKLKIKDLIKEVNDRTTQNNQYEVLSVTKNGIVPQREQFNKQIASEDNTGYKIVRRYNLVFSTMNLWMGSLDVLTTHDIGIVSPAYKVFEFIEQNINPLFGKYFMLSDYMIRIYKLNSEQGASIVRRNLDMDGLLSSIVSVPPVEEQLEISKVLQSADDELTLLNSELEALKQQKKGLMQLLLTGKIRVKC